MAWTNQSKNEGGSNITWDDGTFTEDQSDPMTWDDNYRPFVNTAKNTSAWGTGTKDSSTFSNQTKN